jgi:GT2 family glycosyltransferase
MIPVLGVPILNGPEHLDGLLASIDVPVGRIVVVDNGDVVGDIGHDVIKPRANIGVAASWNTIIKSTPDVPWWLITNHDLVFSPGDLERIAGEVDSSSVILLSGFTAFALGSEVIDRVGWFDENFTPAYYEDNDFDYRCRLAGVRMKALPTGMTHRVSSTLRDDPLYKEQNSKTFESNKAYYLKKWGGQPYMEKFTSPFDAGGDIRDYRVDIGRLGAQRWERAVDR